MMTVNKRFQKKNEKTGNGYRANVAEFDLVMQVWILFSPYYVVLMTEA